MAVQLPKRCTEVVIAIDNDDAGREAARKAATRFLREDRHVDIIVPPDGANDFNDVLTMKN